MISIKELTDKAWSAEGPKGENQPQWLHNYTEAVLRHFVFTSGDRTITMRDRFFRAEGGSVTDENFDFDATLMVSGDFILEQKAEYAQMIAEALNQISTGMKPE